MGNSIKQAIFIIFMAIVISFSANLVSPNGIDFFGYWPNIDPDAVDIDFPPEEEGDPPYIKLTEAFNYYKMNEYLFIDARDVEDYEYGHIEGSFNIPYDYIEEEYWENPPEILNQYDKFVIYCSGTECELSLLLGRDLMYRGYSNIYVFFGGWRQWEYAGMPIDSIKTGEGN